ncbi:hypothetical protein SUGI_0344450 [Cryptomeria japonica]|nr:hypothetical protein SUGI_0344450 [Cryptomeria japonica]
MSIALRKRLRETVDLDYGLVDLKAVDLLGVGRVRFPVTHDIDLPRVGLSYVGPVWHSNLKDSGVGISHLGVVEDSNPKESGLVGDSNLKDSGAGLSHPKLVEDSNLKESGVGLSDA